MTNEEKAHEIVSKKCELIADFIEENNLSKEDRNQLRFKTYDTILEMAELKDEQYKEMLQALPKPVKDLIVELSDTEL